MAAFDTPGAARKREGFIVVVQTGTLERPGAILAAVKRSKWIKRSHDLPREQAHTEDGAAKLSRSAATMPFACRAHGI
jgi:hypothetical protein